MWISRRFFWVADLAKQLLVKDRPRLRVDFEWQDDLLSDPDRKPFDPAPFVRLTGTNKGSMPITLERARIETTTGKVVESRRIDPPEKLHYGDKCEVSFGAMKTIWDSLTHSRDHGGFIRIRGVFQASLKKKHTSVWRTLDWEKEWRKAKP